MRAPYRVCPLGAHVDHQLGTVTALAIDHAVVLAYAPAESAQVRLGSLAFPGEVRFSLDAIAPRNLTTGVITPAGRLGHCVRSPDAVR